MKRFFKIFFKKLWQILVRIFWIAPYLRIDCPDEKEEQVQNEDE